MPPIRSLVSAYRAKLVAIILLFSEIMPSCSRCEEKKLVYIAITAPFSRQPSFYIKYTKSNIRSSCNVKSVSNTKCLYLIRPCSLRSLQLLYLICLRVLHSSIYYKT